MIRIFSIGLLILLANQVPVHAQRTDQPRNIANSIGMEFVWIPAGSFIMGSPPDEIDRSVGEIQHKVTLTRGFYMGVYTVTQEQWKKMMDKDLSEFKGEKNLPVDSVSWDDCQLFLKKLRETDSRPYRLPTEAEWEYCCRAGTTTPFHFGKTIGTDKANYNGILTYGDGKKGVYRQKTTPVGSFPANAWGLHDMHGNVLQWCQDRYANYSKDDVVDPQGPEKGASRPVRGGAWYSHPRVCRSASRHGSLAGDRLRGCGFRVCYNLQ